MANDEKPASSAGKSERALREEKILKFWKDNKIFEKSLEKESPKGEFVFYDGPPFATGLPHYGHIVASAIKDVVPRYFTMQGYHVPRVWGWDCHGLPIENIVEKELGFKHKKDIVKMGIDKFNELCREKVFIYVEEWEKIIPRIGRWVDMEHAYRTMDKPFMESVWWVFKQLYDKGLVYEDYRSMHICPRCETTLSQQEVSEGYKDVKDISVTVKFRIKNPEKIGLTGDVYLLAWTTTPWTLPGNVALAVGKDIRYGVVKEEENNYIRAKEDGEFSGSDLVGLEYEPPFDYYLNDKTLKNHENGWKVYTADFVTLDAGTGIAHEAPAFGADDWELLKLVNLPFVQHVEKDGTFKSEVRDFSGIEVKPRSDDDKIRLGTDIAILKYLQEKNLLYSKENVTHSYPHCWRCDTPLLNYATSSWFVKVETQKEKLIKNAEPINWSPTHIKEGRWGKWLEGARDWSISRQRFWASVIPLWVCEVCKKQRVFGSATELEEASGEKIDDLHKHIVDKIEVPCECGNKMHRIPDVLDTWFDSGSMTYGERHYPFENKEKFEHNFPAQFIAEGLDQTRAWFYYMHVLATSLFNKNAFQNVIVNGIVLAEDGKKMSKKLQNYPDPMEVVDKYGADALRFYLLASPVVQAENLTFSEKGVEEVMKKNLSRLDNVLAFYKLYEKEGELNVGKSVLDKWILVRLNELNKNITSGYESYELDKATRPITDFIDDLSTWYLRRSREKLKDGDKEAIGTLYFVLKELSKMLAPVTPFMADDLYRELRKDKDLESVHLESWPKAGEVDKEILEKMNETRKIVSLALEARAKTNIKVRQPLQSLKARTKNLEPEYIELIKDEVNVKEIIDTDTDTVELDTNLTPELIEEGKLRDVIRSIQDMRKEKGLKPKDKMKFEVPSGEEEFYKKHSEEIKKATHIEF